MPIGPLGENLVFVISQPRAGSTLLQRMLAAHPRMHTASEPWIMLHPIYALRPGGYQAEYNAVHAQAALMNLIGQLPAGVEDYYEGVRRMYGHLYNRALEPSDKTHFLDKTPRYYLCVPELLRTFPNAGYVFLARNPLAVLCSLISTWAPEGRLYHLERWTQDLYDAPQLIVAGAKLAGARGLTVRYEDLIAQPPEQLQAICKLVGVDFDPAMVDYGKRDLPAWSFGDQKGVYQDSRPDPRNAGRWIEMLADAQLWRLAHEYLQALEAPTLSGLGYDRDELRRIVDGHTPASHRRMWTASMTWLSRPALGWRRRLKHGWIRFCHLVRQQGVGAAVIAVVRYLVRRKVADDGQGAAR